MALESTLLPRIVIPYAVADALSQLESAIAHFLPGPKLNREKQLKIVCIGTDRATGDALGPLVGTMLREARIESNQELSSGFRSVEVLGDLDSPVHAANLLTILNQLKSAGGASFVIAVDACLGRPSSVGNISVGAGPLWPGAGVSKVLPPIGDMHIIATVNAGGSAEYLVLQNTRLSVVIKMARTIASALYHVLTHTHSNEPQLHPELPLPLPRE